MYFILLFDTHTSSITSHITATLSPNNICPWCNYTASFWCKWHPKSGVANNIYIIDQNSAPQSSFSFRKTQIKHLGYLLLTPALSTAISPLTRLRLSTQGLDEQRFVLLLRNSSPPFIPLLAKGHLAIY